jgi:hypothetical protein
VVQLLRTYGTAQWATELTNFQATYQGLQALYQGTRQAVQLDVSLPNGFSFTLSPGKHNELERAIIESFRAEFAPGSIVLYVGDTAKKDKYQNTELLAELQLGAVNIRVARGRLRPGEQKTKNAHRVCHSAWPRGETA